MTRGQGLENTQDRRWVKQPNGRYTILDVPIFGEFQDEKRGQVTMQDLEEVIKNFQVDKQENYRYPRIHIGHHEGNENRQGAGYLDEIHIKNGVVYADLVEVTPEVFQAIHERMKYPYVSAEYQPDRKKILSLALLESQTPFFSFPLLKLEEKQQTTSMFNFGFSELRLQEEPEAIEHFRDVQAAWAGRWDMIQKFQENFQEGCVYMGDPEEEKKKSPEMNPTGDGKEPMVGLNDMVTRMTAQMNEVHQYISEMYQWEKEYHDMAKEPEKEMEPKESGTDKDFSGNNPPNIPNSENPEVPTPMKGIENPMKKPGSVAYQSDQALLAMMGEMNKTMQSVVERQRSLEHDVKQKFSALDAQQTYSLEEKALQKFCEEQGFDFQEQSAIFRKFSSSADRKAYIEAISKANRMPTHRMGGIVHQGFAKNEEALIQKYQANPTFYKEANEALAYYKEKSSDPDKQKVRNFQQMWTDKPDRFVSWCAEHPGTLAEIKAGDVD